MNEERWAMALEAIDLGEATHPDATLLEGATWAGLRAAVETYLAEARAAESPAESADTEQGAQAAAELAGSVPDVTLPALTIEATIDEGTRLLGSPAGRIGKQISAIIGKDGLKWWFYATGGVGFWYVRGSRGGGADMPRIAEAQRALEDAGFPVTVHIDDDAKATAPKLSKAETTRRARERARMVNDLSWHLTSTDDGLPCVAAGCGTNVTADTAKIVDDEATGLPVVKCYTHAGDAVSTPLVEQAAVTVLPDDEVADDEGQEQVADAPETAPVVDVDALIDSVRGGNSAATAELLRMLMSGAGAAAPRPRRASRKASTVPVTRPAVVKPERVPTEGPVTIELGLAEDAHVKHTARQVRRDLYAEVTAVYPGVEIHVYADRATRAMSITVTMADAGPRKRVGIVNKVRAAALAVRGVEALVSA